MNDAQFKDLNTKKIKGMEEDCDFQDLSRSWLHAAISHEYHYHFRWLGLPIIQFPADVIAVQELVWQNKPQAIIETGFARGGSAIFYASLLKLIGENRIVVSIDIDIREENKCAVEQHPLSEIIRLVEGSSVDHATFDRVKELVGGRTSMVVLDSNHTHEHVLSELRLYSPLVSPGGYIVVFDTVIEWLPDSLNSNRPWATGNSPMSAVEEFLEENSDFYLCSDFDAKLPISVCPRGILQRNK